MPAIRLTHQGDGCLTGAGLSGMALFFGIWGAAHHRAGTITMTSIATLTFILTLLAWICEIILFSLARSRIQDAGLNASLGNANWIALGGLISLLFTVFTGFCGSFGRYRRKQNM